MRKIFLAISGMSLMTSVAYAEDPVPATMPSSAPAAKPYIHSEDNPAIKANASKNIMTSVAAKTLAADNCLITIRNNSFSDVNVYGRFDDGTYLVPFTIKGWADPQYVSLFYYGYCHGGMEFYIDTVSDGQFKYNGFTPVGKTVKVLSW